MFETSGPSKALSSVVNGFWERRGTGAEHRILPDGCLDFFFDLASGEARVVGAMTAARLYRAEPAAHVFGVRFRPGRAATFLDERADALTDETPALADFRRGLFARLGAPLAEATSFAERRAVVERALLEPGARSRAADARLDRAVRLLEASHGRTSLGDVARAVDLGERHLERLFAERVGVGPKLFSRVKRLERALSLLEAPLSSQAALAAQAGYADEPHLLRELRALAGATPRTLRAERHVGSVQAPPATGL